MLWPKLRLWKFIHTTTTLNFCQERADNFSLFDCSSRFCFLLIEFHCTFSFSCKILPYYVYLYCSIVSSAVYSTVFPKESVTGCDSSLGGGWMIFHFRLFQVPFVFLLIEFHYFFFISYIVLTRFVYYYCIWLDFNTLFSYFFPGFLLFSAKGSVTGCDFRLGSFCYSSVYFLSGMHLHSGYYYYDYVVIGVLRSSLFNEILFGIGLLLYKEVKK